MVDSGTGTRKDNPQLMATHCFMFWILSASPVSRNSVRIKKVANLPFSTGPPTLLTTLIQGAFTRFAISTGLLFIGTAQDGFAFYICFLDDGLKIGTSQGRAIL